MDNTTATGSITTLARFSHENANNTTRTWFDVISHDPSTITWEILEAKMFAKVEEDDIYSWRCKGVGIIWEDVQYEDPEGIKQAETILSLKEPETLRRAIAHMLKRSQMGKEDYFLCRYELRAKSASAMEIERRIFERQS